ncbi:MAG: tyrosine-type recombinase/integrase [Chthoniobacteraceae bacterium]
MLDSGKWWTMGDTHSIAHSVMAGLYKQPGSSRWTAVFTNATGKQIRRSTKKRDRKEAMSVAVEWENAAKAGREGRLFEAQARKIISEMLEQSTGQSLVFYTSRGWLNEWLSGKKGTTSERTRLKYQQVADDFLEHLGERAELSLKAVSVSDVRSFRDALQAKGLSPVTVNLLARKVLAAPFEAAKRLGYIAANPCAGVEALKDGVAVEKDAFTDAQLKALVDAAEGDWKGFILCGATTGLRMGDIARLCWENIDAQTGFFHVRASKTGTMVHSPILPDMLNWLDTQPQGIGKAPLFPSLAKQSGTGRNGLSEQFKRIMVAAGIKGRVLRSGKGEGRTTNSLSFHSLRHTFNSTLANAGVAQEIRQKLTGHSSAAMNDRYTHHELETLRAAVAKMPAIGGSGK